MLFSASLWTRAEQIKVWEGIEVLYMIPALLYEPWRDLHPCLLYAKDHIIFDCLKVDSTELGFAKIS